MRKVMMQLTQPMHDADGNLLHQPGEQFDEGDKLLDALPPGSYKPVIVDSEDAASVPAAAPEPKLGAAKQQTKSG